MIQETTEPLKVCGTCLVPKPFSEFNKGHNKFGLGYNCKPCAKLYRRAHYVRNKEKTLKQNRAWIADHPEEHKELCKNWAKTNKHRNRGYVQKWKKKRWWSLRYGITKKDYAILSEFQKNCCAICKRTRAEFGRRWPIDHDHKCCPGVRWCGKCIRGLLCMRCNMAIGMLLDDPNFLENAISYLKNPPTNQIPNWPPSHGLDTPS